MKTTIVWLILAASAAFAQHDHDPAAAKGPATNPAGIIAGLGRYHHAIHTSKPVAQRFFDQGLNLYYGFNHEEAVRAFEEAAKLDPKSPMPWWGKSLSLGRNYNRDEEPELEKAAYEALRTAIALAHKDGAPEERDYVTAL